MRPIDGDALFCKFWSLADPYQDKEKVYPQHIWNTAAAMSREAPTIDPIRTAGGCRCWEWESSVSGVEDVQ